MKKKLLSLALAVLMLLPVLSVPAAAATESAAIPAAASDNIIMLEDGCYIVIRPVSSQNATRSYVASDIADIDLYSVDNVLICTATLNTAYTYDGRHAFCIRADVSYKFHDSSYYLVESNLDKTEDVATLTFTVGKKVLGITVSKETHVVRAICDRSGIIFYE